MVRSYKRDAQGQFASGGSSSAKAKASKPPPSSIAAKIGRALAPSEKQKAAQDYRIEKVGNRNLSRQAVEMGLLTKKQSRAALKNANAKAKDKFNVARKGKS